MQIKNDGGPAFPPTHDPATHQSGMSLRDWFAGQAPVDWTMAQQAAGLGTTVSPDDRLKLWGAMSILRYEYADAMLAERTIDRGQK